MQPIEKPRDYATRIVIAVFASLFVLVAFVAIAVFKIMPQSQPAQSVVAPKERKGPDKPLEYKLAVTNAGGFVPENDITVNRFRYLLSDLQKKTGYTQQQIADLNTYAVDTLRDKYGRNVKLLDFMEQSVRPLSAAKVDYKEVVAAMITLMGRGQN